jgi:two-component system cell cycle sensor histidine kinase/response regulator CckA
MVNVVPQDSSGDTHDSTEDAATKLRRRAESRMGLPLAKVASIEEMPPEQARKVVQELQTHQIELEMQNEELCRAHLELEATREKYFDLYDLAPVGYFTLSERSLILEANLTAATLVGMTRHQLIKLPFTRLILPEDQTLYYLKRKALFEEGTPQLFELRLMHVDGKEMWASIQTALSHEPSGVPVCRATVSDITRRKQAETALFQRQKLESLGILAGGIAHDFNNLLTAMLGNLELADLDEIASDREKHLDVLRDSILRAAGLCKQMLAYSGKGHFVRESFQLGELIQAYMGFMKVSIAKTAEIRLELEPGLPAVEGDVSQVEQALMNLVLNAAESLPLDGGTLTIRTRLRTLKMADLSSLVPGTEIEPGHYVVLEVEDTGSGMAPDTLSKIFDPFFTTKFTGRGLGLAALLGIMRGNRGGVQVRSELGKGTCFSLWFPLTKRAVRLPEVPAQDPSAFRGEGTILVVEDEESVRTVLASILQHMGFEVLTSTNGEEGLNTYREHAQRIRLVLMDLTMPRMGGVEASRHILDEHPEACIVLMSGYVQNPAQGLPEARGIKGFLKKPYLRAELTAMLMQCLSLTPTNVLPAR